VTGNITQQLNANNAFVNRVTSINAGIRGAQTDAINIASQPITAGTGLMAFGGLLKSQASNIGSAFGGVNWGGTGTSELDAVR
jgi:hypothetical protein